MLKLDNHPSGRHFLHIPGPSPVPPRVLRSISYQTIDHRGPEFGQFGLQVLDGIKEIFKTEQPVMIYSASFIFGCVAIFCMSCLWPSAGLASLGMYKYKA